MDCYLKDILTKCLKEIKQFTPEKCEKLRVKFEVPDTFDYQAPENLTLLLPTSMNTHIRKGDCMSENEIKVRFELETALGEHYVQESQFEVFTELGDTDVDRIGEQLNVFLKQAGYIRKNDYIFMEDVNEDEYEAISDFLQSLRNGKEQI